MTPTSLISDSITDLIAADTTYLAAAAVKNVKLVKDPFTPGSGTDYAGLVVADFDGSGAKTAASGAQQSFVDALTGQSVVQLIEPAGGWHWVTTGVTNLPQTIYGYVVTNDDNSETFGSELLTEPITLTASGQAIDLDQVRFTLVLSPLS